MELQCLSVPGHLFLVIVCPDSLGCCQQLTLADSTFADSLFANSSVTLKLPNWHTLPQSLPKSSN